jgi:hypothetical protein
MKKTPQKILEAALHPLLIIIMSRAIQVLLLPALFKGTTRRCALSLSSPSFPTGMRLAVCNVAARRLSDSVVKGYNKSSSTSTASEGSPSKEGKPKVDCSDPVAVDDDDEEDMVEMFAEGPAGIEWNGPTRGGTRPEPTRYGDWERKGRISDF